MLPSITHYVMFCSPTLSLFKMTSVAKQLNCFDDSNISVFSSVNTLLRFVADGGHLPNSIDIAANTEHRSHCLLYLWLETPLSPVSTDAAIQQRVPYRKRSPGRNLGD